MTAMCIPVLIVSLGIGDGDEAKRRQAFEAWRRVVESRLADMHQLLMRKQSKEHKKLLRNATIQVRGTRPCLCNFNASAGNNKITIPTTTCSVLEQLAFCVASDQLKGTELTGEYLERLFWAHSKGQSIQRADLLEFMKFIEDEPHESSLSQQMWAVYEICMMWLLAHEQAHIYLEHKGYDEITKSKARQQESDADERAWKTLVDLDKTGQRSTHAFMPLTVFFIIMAPIDAEKGALSRSTTHPHPLDRIVSGFDLIDRNRLRDNSRMAKEIARSISRARRSMTNLITQFERMIEED